VLNEPGNLWWGNLPTAAYGLILPSQFAAHFWESRVNSSSSEFRRFKYFVINPGVNMPRPNQNVNFTDIAIGIDETANTIIVGWAGRFESQKSPGLMVRLACALKEIYRYQSIKVCILMAGGGTFLGNVTKKNEFEADALGGEPGSSTLEDMAVQMGLKVGTCPQFAADIMHRNYRTGDTSSDSNRNLRDPEKKEKADIEFTGSLSHTELLGVLGRRIDILVHTNVLEETFCIVNVESMARQVPVVSFGVGGVSEYLPISPTENNCDTVDADSIKHGIIVRPSTMGELVGRVSALIDDHARRRQMGVAAQFFVNPFTPPIFNNQLTGRNHAKSKDMSNDRMARQYAVLYHTLTTEDDIEQKNETNIHRCQLCFLFVACS
jgi:glycosyltransferase involved in cell wall biosynthesis